MTRLTYFLVFLIAGTALSAEPWTYSIDRCPGVDTGCEAADVELAEWALKAWEQASKNRLVWERASDPAKAKVRIRWATARDGLYGEMRPINANGKQVAAHVYVRAHASQLGPEVDKAAREDRLYRDTVVFLTIVHESGHALGLHHTASYDDIMYSFAHGGDILEYFARYRRKLARREDIRKANAISEQDQLRLIQALDRGW